MNRITNILCFAGWIGFVITLLVVIFFNKCGGKTEHTIEKQTVINNYYDSAIRTIPQPVLIPGKPILVEIPAVVDTEQVLRIYFSKYPLTRIFQDSALKATLIDTLYQNHLTFPGNFSYQWLKPVKTVESTTVTVKEEPKSKMKILLGAYGQFSGSYVNSFGPELYLQGKKGNLYGINYDVKNKAVGVKAAYNLNGLFKNNK